MPNFLNLLSSLTPNHTGQKKPQCWKKALYLFFPRFNIKKFTFWFGAIWVAFNMFVIIQAKTYKIDDVQKPDCMFIRWGASVTPFIRFDHGYHRIFIGPFLCEDPGQLMIGIYILWSYGFLYEKYFTKGQMFITVFGSTLISSLISCFLEFQHVRCAGTIFIAAWASLYIFLLWDVLEYNIVLRLAKLVMFIIKVMALLMASLKERSDPISTVCAFGLGFLLALSFVKKIKPNTDEEKKFILLRLKIFIFIISLMLLLMGIAYTLAMYDKKKHREELIATLGCTPKKPGPSPVKIARMLMGYTSATIFNA